MSGTARGQMSTGGAWHPNIHSQLADGNFIIPQAGIIRSLNISVACAVTLYEAYRQKTIAGHYDKTKLDGEALKELMDKWGYEDIDEQ